MGRLLILLDIHTWFCWVQGDPQLRPETSAWIEAEEKAGLAVSAISLLEVARATALGGMALPIPTQAWLETALAYPGVRLIALEPAIVVQAYRLPEPFHVATARVHGLPLVTADEKILADPHVRCLR